MRKHTEIILKKQFEIAGHLDKFDEIDFKNSQWYNEYTWTSEQESKFEDWVIDYLYKTSEARKELVVGRRRNKKHLGNWFSWWNLSYGFRVKYNEE